MTAVRPEPTHRAAPAPTGSTAPTGRHARRETGVPSGPLVPLRALAPAPKPAGGRLVVDTSYCRLTPHLGARKVAVSVDGLPLRFAWGRTPIDLPAGRHLVEIEVEHRIAGRRSWGHVADAVPVAAGHTVEVYYRAPALPRLDGSLGPARQRTAGLALCVALLAAAGAALIALLVVAVVLLVA
ncbi:hypothetical protein [Actinomycetospora cinnamomea]|uniref:Uncharacterized protein n=1 Tax=Actinomycetospora cinnamomea TaxID=663609 RepID=A0A2U1FQU3_9PSEU|nr:hypothetical protein [Actinomycetospora cinnamomea]PVZ14519.1 hypothetical protein C8D89_101384 [Actinomycetospora cinnamomea]